MGNASPQLPIVQKDQNKAVEQVQIVDFANFP